MHERDEILVMLLTSGFFGTSFWPVVCGRVDIGTLAGWVELCANFGTALIVGGLLGLLAAIGYVLAGFPLWCVRATRAGAVLGLGVRARSSLGRFGLGGWRIVLHVAMLIGRAGKEMRCDESVRRR
jgi:hypothetical protein